MKLFRMLGCLTVAFVLQSCGDAPANLSQSPKSDTRPFDYVTLTDQAAWNGLLATGPLPKRSQLLVESSTQQPISNKDALALLDTLSNKGIASDEYRNVLMEERSPFRPFSHHRITFVDKSIEAAAARRSAPSAHVVTRLGSANELEQIGLSLSHTAYSQQTATGWSTGWHDSEGRTIDTPAVIPKWTPAYSFYHQGMPRMGLFFTKTEGSPVSEVVTCTLIDSHSKVVFDRAWGINRDSQESEIRMLFSNLPVFHHTTIDVVLEYRSSPSVDTAIAPAELGPIYDDGNGGVVALLAKGSPGIMTDWMDATEWGAFVSESPMMQEQFPPGFYFKTWPRVRAGSFTVELLAEDKETVIPSSPNHSMGVDRLIYCVNNRSDFERVKHFRIKHRRDYHRVIFPLETSWLPALPESGDLFDVRIPYAKVIDRRFLDQFVARVAQITLDAPINRMLPTNSMTAPKDAVSEVLTDFSVREAMKRHAAEFYSDPDPAYDYETATLKAMRR